MAPSFLIVGATGNTGRSVVETLSQSFASNGPFAGHRILALTRSSNGAVAQKLAKLPHVEIVEKNWTLITAAWLREHEVVRAYMASHNEPMQFAEESTFFVAALRAGVEYVVRISTTAPNVKADSDAYYPRAHWAIEAMLSSPEFEKLKWSSLQANMFYSMYLSTAVDYIKKCRNGEKPNVLPLMADKDALNAPIDPDDVGTAAGHLLLQQDVTPHNHARYVLNGPEDITGQQILSMVEDQSGSKVESVSWRDTHVLDPYIEAKPEIKHLISTVHFAPVCSWEGKTKAEMTSKAIMELSPPKVAPAEAFKALLEG